MHAPLNSLTISLLWRCHQHPDRDEPLDVRRARLHLLKNSLGNMGVLAGDGQGSSLRAFLLRLRPVRSLL
jgi:hypothetical protein